MGGLFGRALRQVFRRSPSSRLGDDRFVYSESRLVSYSSWSDLNELLDSDRVRFGPALGYNDGYFVDTSQINPCTFQIGIYRREDPDALVKPFTGWDGEKITLDKAIKLAERKYTDYLEELRAKR